MDTRAHLEASFTLVTDRVGDPTARVYADLFAQYPELEALFARDTSGSIRGHMLSEVLSGLLDLSDGKSYVRSLFRSERVNHHEVGVAFDVFPVFFASLKQSFQAICGTAWNDDIEDAWVQVLADIDVVLTDPD
jgi:hemoglobin-like flavoprotein